MKNRIVYFLLITVLTAAGELSGQQKPSPVQNLFTEVKSGIESRNSAERIQAVTKAGKSKNEDIFELVRERLLVERNSEVNAAILDEMARRGNRKDFFYIIDYLKVGTDHRNLKKAITVAYEIHAPRTRYELGLIFNNLPERRLLALFFAELFQKPEAEDINWFEKNHSENRLSEYWLNLRFTEDEKICSILQPYTHAAFFQPSRFIADYYWYAACSVHNRAGTDTALLPRIPVSKLSELRPGRHRRFLAYLNSLGLELTEKAALLNAPSGITRSFITGLLIKKITAGNTDAVEKLRQMLRTENSAYVFYTLTDRYRSLTPSLLKASAERCPSEKAEALCFRLKLLHNSDTALSALMKSKRQRFDRLIRSSMRQVLKSDTGENPALIRRILSSPDSSVRMRFISAAGSSILKEYAVTIAAFMNTDPDRTVRYLFYAEIMRLELEPHYRKQLSYLPVIAEN